MISRIHGQRWPRRPRPPAGDPTGSDAPPAPLRRPPWLVLPAIVLLSAWLIFEIKYRYAIVPYLTLAVLMASLWRLRAGIVSLVFSLGVLGLTVLSDPRHSGPGGRRALLPLALLGLVCLGARALWDGLERQRRTELRLIAELSAAVERLRESERRQAEAVASLAERNQLLQAAQEELLRSARLAALGQFSATVAHELRNPLNVVKLSAHYAITHLPDPDEKLRRSLLRLDQHVDRACEIINDLLRFSRLPPPELQPAAVNGIVRDAAAALPASERVTVECALAPDLPPILADARQIEQAVGNLGLNAIQAMPGGGRLTITTRLAGDEVEIAVRDTGPGIPEELHAHVFDPFFTTKATGTGLGLPLVREIAAAHGGHVALQSPAGEGACFTLRLPLATSPVPAGPAPPACSDHADATLDCEDMTASAV